MPRQNYHNLKVVLPVVTSGLSVYDISIQFAYIVKITSAIYGGLKIYVTMETKRLTFDENVNSD